MPSSKSRVLRECIELSVQAIPLNISLVRRQGHGIPIVFLHGWGGSKEDYTDLQYLEDDTFDGRPFLAYDAPGSGQTMCGQLGKVDINFLVSTAEKVLAHFGIRTLHLVGHSMGGLTALQLSRQNRDSLDIRSFVNIKGNLAPEDCFLSRQINQYACDDASKFFDDFISRTSASPLYSSAFYASIVRQRVKIEAMPGIFTSMVQLSDHGDLLTAFLALRCFKVFMYGEQYAGLSYLPTLRANGVKLVEVPQAGHFPMYSNPFAMWEGIRECIKKAEVLPSNT